MSRLSARLTHGRRACARRAAAMAALVCVVATPSFAAGDGARPGVARLALEVGADGAPGADWGAIEDHTVVALDLHVALDGETGVPIRNAGRSWTSMRDCDFGLLADVAEIAPPTGDNHLVVTVRPGDPGRHAANAAFCEYAPAPEAADLRQALRLRGCFLAMSFSIPTARHLVLNPLPAHRCGFLK